MRKLSGVKARSFFSRKRWRAALLSASLVLVLLTGCWPLQDGGTPNVPPGSPTPGVTEGQTVIPQVEGELNIVGGSEDPPSLDPALASDSYSHFVVRQLFSGLVTFDNDLNIIPDVASALPQVSADGTVYTFSLRRNRFN